jgi:hypothetical protein
MKDLSIYILKEDSDFQYPPQCDKTENALAAAMKARQPIQHVEDATQADFVLFPYSLDPIYSTFGLLGTYRFVSKIRRFEEFAAKTIFFLSNDLSFEFDFPSIFFRECVDNRVNGPSSIAIPYTIPDVGLGVEFGNFSYDTSFVGYVGSAPLRVAMLKSFYEAEHRLRFLIKARVHHHHHEPDAQSKARYELDYLESLIKSCTVLCPRGTGVSSFRFFETLSMGRIPVLISDPGALPFADRIDYDSMIVRIPEAEISNTPQIIENWLAARTGDQILDLARQNRATWMASFSKEALPNQLVASLVSYRNRQAAQWNAGCDLALVLDEQRLFRRIKSQFEQALAQEDDVNALSFLVNLKSILATHGKPVAEANQAIANLRALIGEKNRIAASQFPELSQ